MSIGIVSVLFCLSFMVFISTDAVTIKEHEKLSRDTRKLLNYAQVVWKNALKVKKELNIENTKEIENSEEEKTSLSEL